MKASVVDAATLKCLASATYPETESPITALQPGWAEQDPERWWQDVQEAIRRLHQKGSYNPHDIGAIGIAYQMHGLVITNQSKKVLRSSIIWCDSRAVSIGDEAYKKLGSAFCLSHMLNSPGNFTASKLAWVKQHEPEIFERVDKMMLPGDFIAMKMTGEVTTSPSALSEGILWDFSTEKLAQPVLDYIGFPSSFIPPVQKVFSDHGKLHRIIAEQLGLRSGIPVTYKAGDQPNNALSLHVLEPGEVATTAGTSGVIYGVSDQRSGDTLSRINSFAHVNHDANQPRIGILLCINGAGILNRWLRDTLQLSYADMNALAATVKPGSDGIVVLPFGNGAERMLQNKTIGAQWAGLDLNRHGRAQLVRAAQEGIVFAMRYGFDVMRSNGLAPQTVRTAYANLFLSPVFAQAFADVNQVTLEFFDGDGSVGAAYGAGIGAGVIRATDLRTRKPSATLQPTSSKYEEHYQRWKEHLEILLHQPTTH